MSKTKNLQMVHMAISFAIMVIFRFLPTFSEVTVGGMQIFGCFVGALYGWMTVGLLWPSILGLCMLAFADITSMQEVFAMGFANENVILIFAMLFIAGFISELQLADWIVIKLTSNKRLQGHPYMLFSFWILACYIISILTVSMVAAVLAVTFFRSIVKTADAKPYTKANSAFLCGSGLAIGMGAICLPFKAATLIILSVYTTVVGGTIDYASYMYCVFPSCTLVLVFYILLCKFILRVDLSEFSKGIKPRTVAPLSKQQKVSLGFIFLLLCLFILPGILPSEWLFTVFLNRLTMPGICLAFIVLLMFIHVDQKPLLNFKDVSRHFSWDTYIFTVFCMPICSLLTNDGTGIKETLSITIAPLTNIFPPTVLVIFLTLLAALLTNFLNNMPVSIVFITLLCSTTTVLDGVNIYAASIAIMIACYFAVMTPVASGYNAIIFSANDLIEIRGHMSFCIKAVTGIAIVLSCLIYPVSSLIL